MIFSEYLVGFCEEKELWRWKKAEDGRMMMVMGHFGVELLSFFLMNLFLL